MNLKPENLNDIIRDFDVRKCRNGLYDCDYNLIESFFEYLYSRPYYDEDLEIIKRSILQNEENNNG